VIHASSFKIQSHLDGGDARLTLAGELDMATVPRVEQAVSALLEQGVRGLVVDLSGITFVDSSGLRMFISLNERAAAEGFSLSLTRPSDRSLAVFQITGAEENLPFIEDSGTPS
jgi:anti-sigma B factor antagonist